METVSQLRAETFAFWEESKAEFEGEAGGAARAVEHALSRLDRHGNMGFPDFDSPVWFVYGMCKKAADNSSQIDSVLRSIRTKLELLGRQDDCPICRNDEFYEDVIQMQSRGLDGIAFE